MRTDTLPLRAPAVEPDPAFAARPGLVRLRDALQTAAAPPPRRGPWKEPPVFFFDPARQAELDAARAPLPPADRHPLDARVAAELPALIDSVDVRRVARTIPGLREAAAALAGRLPAATDLFDLLAVPDDEVVVALDPARGVGVRLLVRGVADVGQLQTLLADAVPELVGRGPGRWQAYRPAALRADGTLPEGVSGYEHWLWPHAPLAAVPLVRGERVLLLGPPAFPAADAGPRFPELAADVTVLAVLAPAEVAARLGRPAPRVLARAA
ncbi:hypothetical protein [Urbifossiella limnaea]|uniref:Uncharacterized protein n=1 Tax=Urbifossiella limnaea TaxID=2528023 RepID=A0A517Y2Q0_9BACT|nr:hypothetical protein [Urbifossiella limnaea]QDU24012.1 hypothetical protein ETAA1_60230 [Urbifossiella limnaea]